ncbi:MAG: hypothetical protein JWQ08_226 [Deinococcus sp.]|nr:hypothetical protein [Deinococcus sp.]
MSRRLLSVALLLACNALAQVTPPAPALSSLLTPRTVAVERLEVSLIPELRAINQRLQQAVQNQPDWYVALFKATPAGQFMAYDARFGVTAQEYERLQQPIYVVKSLGFGDLILFEPKGSAGKVYVRGSAAPDELSGLSFQPRSGGTFHVATRVGTAGGQRPVTIGAPDLLGARVGYVWQLSNSPRDLQNDREAFLRLSRMTATGQLVFEFQMYEVRDKKVVRDVAVILRSVEALP